jgi:hypothetical protein
MTFTPNETEPEQTSHVGDLQISLRMNQERRYKPGDLIQGQVTVQGQENYRITFAEAILFLRTAGMGDCDEVRSATRTLLPPGKEVSRSFYGSFDFYAPPAPWTYYGTLIKLHWMVGIYVQTPGRKNNGLLELPLIIHPNPETLELPTIIPGNNGKPARVHQS